MRDAALGLVVAEFQLQTDQRKVLGQRFARPVLAAPVEVTAGRDYALHPSLAATADGQLWCAFDVITVVGHGGSGE